MRRVRRALASRLLQGARGGLRVFALKSRARRGRSLPSLFVFDEASNTADPFRRPMDLESADRALPEPAATNTYMLPGAASGALKAWRGSVAHQIFSHVSRGTGTEDTEDDSEGEEEAKAREPPRGRAEALAQKAHQALEELVELRRQQLLPTLRPEPAPLAGCPPLLPQKKGEKGRPSQLVVSFVSGLGKRRRPGAQQALPMQMQPNSLCCEFGSHALGLRPPLGGAPWKKKQQQPLLFVLALRSPWSRRAAPCSPDP